MIQISAQSGGIMDYVKDTHTYKIVDNHEIQADVYRYPDEQVRPAIIWIHGGALIFGTRNWLPPDQLEIYLKSGYTVISIDYRLAPESKLPAIIEDLEDAYAWIRAEGLEVFKIDPDRVAFVGHSAGGYLTLMAGFRLQPRPRVLVSFYGYGNLTGKWYAQPDSFYNQMPLISKERALESVGNSLITNTPTEFSPDGRYLFYLYCRQQGLWPSEVCGHDPETERTWYSAYEPLRNVTSDYPPTMLLHGEKDTDVPFEQSVLMTAVLKRQDVAHEFISNPGWEHMFDGAVMGDRTVQGAFEQVLLFLDKYIQ